VHSIYQSTKTQKKKIKKQPYERVLQCFFSCLKFASW